METSGVLFRFILCWILTCWLYVIVSYTKDAVGRWRVRRKWSSHRQALQALKKLP